MRIGKVKPMSECLYPRCEECDKYHGHYCTVPIVITKMDSFILIEKLKKMENTITELEKLVTDEILGDK